MTKSRLALSIAAASIVVAGITGCGGGDSVTPTSASGTDVTVERGKVFTTAITDVAGNVGLHKGGGVYHFTTDVVYPITITPNAETFVDVNDDGVIDGNDTLLAMPLKSYSNIITPLTTLAANSVTNEANASAEFESNLQTIADNLNITLADVKALPSKNTTAMKVANAIYYAKLAKDKNVTINAMISDVNSTFDANVSTLGFDISNESNMTSWLVDTNLTLEKTSTDAVKALDITLSSPVVKIFNGFDTKLNYTTDLNITSIESNNTTVTTSSNPEEDKNINLSLSYQTSAPSLVNNTPVTLTFTIGEGSEAYDINKTITVSEAANMRLDFGTKDTVILFKENSEATTNDCLVYSYDDKSVGECDTGDFDSYGSEGEMQITIDENTSVILDYDNKATIVLSDTNKSTTYSSSFDEVVFKHNMDYELDYGELQNISGFDINVTSFSYTLKETINFKGATYDYKSNGDTSTYKYESETGRYTSSYDHKNEEPEPFNREINHIYPNDTNIIYMAYNYGFYNSMPSYIFKFNGLLLTDFSNPEDDVQSNTTLDFSYNIEAINMKPINDNFSTSLKSSSSTSEIE